MLPYRSFCTTIIQAYKIWAPSSPPGEGADGKARDNCSKGTYTELDGNTGSPKHDHGTARSPKHGTIAGYRQVPVEYQKLLQHIASIPRFMFVDCRRWKDDHLPEFF